MKFSKKENIELENETKKHVNDRNNWLRKREYKFVDEIKRRRVRPLPKKKRVQNQ